MGMMVTGSDNTYLFDLSEPGRPDQCNFRYPKYLLQEVETWLDGTFKNILKKYRAITCKDVLRGIGHVRRENRIFISPKINANLNSLNLRPVTNMVNNREVHLGAPPQN